MNDYIGHKQTQKDKILHGGEKHDVIDAQNMAKRRDLEMDTKERERKNIRKCFMTCT